MFRFIGSWRHRLPDYVDITIFLEDKEVTIIRRELLFFYYGQKTTIRELSKFFTDKAIATFEADGYIKINK